MLILISKVNEVIVFSPKKKNKQNAAQSKMSIYSFKFNFTASNTQSDPAVTTTWQMWLKGTCKQLDHCNKRAMTFTRNTKPKLTQMNIEKDCVSTRIFTCSSVTRGGPGGGGSSPSHWLENYGTYPVFSTFEADFCTKNENSLRTVLAMRVGREPNVILSRKTGF